MKTLTFKEQMDVFCISKKEDIEKRKEFISPKGKYKLSISEYKTKEGAWSVSRGIVTLMSSGEILADIKRNYPHFPYAFFEGHENGHDYIICGENYMGQTIIELDTKERTDDVSSGFCWIKILPSPTGKYLAVVGCVWGLPRETGIYDFFKPMSLSLPCNVRGFF